MQKSPLWYVKIQKCPDCVGLFCERVLLIEGSFAKEPSVYRALLEKSPIYAGLWCKIVEQCILHSCTTALEVQRTGFKG